MEDKVDVPCAICSKPLKVSRADVELIESLKKQGLGVGAFYCSQECASSAVDKTKH